MPSPNTELIDRLNDLYLAVMLDFRVDHILREIEDMITLLGGNLRVELNELVTSPDSSFTAE